MSKEVTLREFAGDISLAVNAFYLYWRKQQNEQVGKKKNDMWSNEMSLEEWQNHFFTYLRDNNPHL